VAGLTLKLQGQARFRRAMKRLDEEGQKCVRDEINATALEVTGEAKRRCPVDTGRLRASIRPRFDTDGFAADVYTDVKYAPFIEYGTKRMRAQPFLFPAWESIRRAFLGRLRRCLDTAGARARRGS
jgi:HK97 gp10 family phage protein